MRVRSADGPGGGAQYGVKVCMSEFTNQEVESHFVTREIDTVAVKGKADGVKIYELICSKDDADFVRHTCPLARLTILQLTLSVLSGLRVTSRTPSRSGWTSWSMRRGSTRT